MKAQAALVGTQGAVESHAEAAIDVHLAAVVLPWHAEDDLPLGLADALDDLVLGVLRMFTQHWLERFADLANRLMKFGFAAVAANHIFDDLIDTGTNGRQDGVLVL
jgi:hypothetical protein